jgi:hypothetical protein
MKRMTNPMTKKLTIEQTIANMMTENTGTHMLDSGGSNGRNWQRNQGKTVEHFKSLPSATAEIYYSLNCDDYEIDPCVNIFHLLTGGVLELDDFCHQFNAIEVGQWNSKFSGVDHEGDMFLLDNDFNTTEEQRHYGFNTCNDNLNHSQVMCGHMLEREGLTYVLLQIHGGADVRGGYTDAKLFKLDDWAEFYNLVNDSCGFSSPDGHHGISWHGELINEDGQGASDDDIKALALSYGCNADNPSVTIEGDAYLDF